MAEPIISVGKLGKPHGLSGAFRFLMSRELKNRKKVPTYFLLHKGKAPVPFFIKEISWNGFNEGFILFEDISSPEAARQFSGSELSLYEKDASTLLKKDAGENSYLQGFTVIDELRGEIGLLEEVIESPGQTLISIAGTGTIIPLADDFIVEINKKKKLLVLNLPEGLLDL